MSFEVIGCQIMHFGPHRAIPGRVTGVVRVRIREGFMGTTTEYSLDLKVKADCNYATSDKVRQSLLAHAAHQLNKLKTRHSEKLPAAAE